MNNLTLKQGLRLLADSPHDYVELEASMFDPDDNFETTKITGIDLSERNKGFCSKYAHYKYARLPEGQEFVERPSSTKEVVESENNSTLHNSVNTTSYFDNIESKLKKSEELLSEATELIADACFSKEYSKSLEERLEWLVRLTQNKKGTKC